MAFIAVMTASIYLLWRNRLYDSRWMMRILMLSFPLPFLANSAGWLTTELARQPWLVYGLVRTDSGYSHLVSAGNSLIYAHRVFGFVCCSRIALSFS